MEQKNLDELKESGANETKSTAGDKHETALAMLQIEQANTRVRLNELQQQLAVLEKINLVALSEKILSGSLIQTDKGYFFLSIAAGKTIVEGQTVIAISPQSPLGLQLINARKGKSVAVNTTSYTILKVE